MTRIHPPKYSIGVFIILFWVLFIIIDVLKKSVFSITEPTYVYYFYFPGFIYWILLTFPTYALFKASSRMPIVYRIGFLLLLGLIFGVVKNLISWVSYYAILWITDDTLQTGFAAFIGSVIPFYYYESIIIAWVVLIVFFIHELGVKFREKSIEASQLEAQLVQSKLQALKMQLHPHFLFNAHNTISMLIRTKKYDTAVDMVSGLSDLLRTSLLGEVGQLITLKEELELLRKYLYIEQMRFEDNLTVSFDIDENLLQEKVPGLIAQPLLENAFKHGISKFLGHAELVVTARAEDSYLILSVQNSGPLLPEGFDLSDAIGIGLSNTQNRLEQLYSGRAKLTLENWQEGVVQSIHIPFDGKN